MKPDVFQINQTPDAVSKLIGAYFGDVSSYFRLESKDRLSFEREYSLNVFDEELKALHKLALEDQASNFDDRRFTIEIQSKDDVLLKSTNPLAVIAPTVYFDDIGFRNHVENIWKA